MCSDGCRRAQAAGTTTGTDAAASIVNLIGPTAAAGTGNGTGNDTGNGTGTGTGTGTSTGSEDPRGLRAAAVAWIVVAALLLVGGFVLAGWRFTTQKPVSCPHS